MTDVKPFDRNRIDLVPKSPGVYLMKDATGSVIYVGKAVDLRSRLRSYFAAQPQGNAKVQAMVSHVVDVSTILCDTETEALMLESTLIKKHQPRYNILLRDDKDYPYVKVTMQELYPRVVKAYRIGDDRKRGARYYGPFLSGDLRQALEALRSIFPMKTCRRVLPRDIGKERPCLNYYIGRCIGPCRGDVPAESYRAVMQGICRFFEGRYDGIIRDLETKMNEASAAMDFEQAALFRDRLQALQRLLGRQKVVSSKKEDLDVLNVTGNGSEIALQKLEVRDGRLTASSAFFFPDDPLDPVDVLHSFIVQHYPDIQSIPPLILLPETLPDQEELSHWLATMRDGRCQLHTPLRGAKKDWLAMAEANAKESLYRHTLMGGSRHLALQEALRLLSAFAADEKPLHRIEAIDVSHTGGQDMAASMVVFLDGRPQRQHYRRFKIDPEQGVDDHAAIREVLKRRLARLQDSRFGSLPDLILLDGGKGHVTTGQKVLADLSLNIPLAGMVKDERHRTRGLVTGDGRIIELRRSEGSSGLGDRDRAWLSLGDASEETSLAEPKQLALLRLLTAIQNEAHRFAQSYRQRLQKKRTTRFRLEGIPGVGPGRRKKLLLHFKTIQNISRASLSQLQEVAGISEPIARNIHDHFHSEER